MIRLKMLNILSKGARSCMQVDLSNEVCACVTWSCMHMGIARDIPDNLVWTSSWNITSNVIPSVYLFSFFHSIHLSSLCTGTDGISP